MESSGHDEERLGIRFRWVSMRSDSGGVAFSIWWRSVGIGWRPNSSFIYTQFTRATTAATAVVTNKCDRLTEVLRK